ncbi:hypothetical protein ASE70_14570 [Sphingomonas sp. Leaf22]|uniref:exopolysaccharide biosynthesis polyprenyl glycosylphosphotransferase n=1 Tax=unclassified Sphingomonas TaxID=196159 RepID=UPI000701A45D|nr:MULTISPECIES: exopolysaccharide biosynthesis polyprenyl glycosylphosphotransferase [unclassified Sphingomonas]KQM93091.1 hypothetical protein ASE70_14570 [Sphingomonas sp. Leaf22]
MLALDITAIAFGFLLPSHLLKSDFKLFELLTVTAIVYTGIAFNSGAFSLRSAQDVSVDTAPAVRALLFTYGVLFLLSYFLKLERDLSRLLIGIAMVVGTLTLVVFRQIVAIYVESRLRDRLLVQMLILDGADIAPPPGYRVVRASDIGLVPDLRDPAMLNAFGSLIRECERVVVACSEARCQDWAMLLKGANVRGDVVVDTISHFGALGVSHIGDRATLTVSVGPLSLRDAFAKRAFDLAVCVPALIALAPALLLTALLIKLDSPGPVLFRQRRVGRGNEFFDILKFRSMRVENCDADGNVSTRRDDDRITRVGYFIRRTSIDELPQLLNVFLGQMSIVGPRPHALGSLAGNHLFWDVDTRYWHRHALKPGITGLAQVRGYRGATNHVEDLTRRLQADLEYAANWSFWRDVTILAMTVKVVVHKNTY